MKTKAISILFVLPLLLLLLAACQTGGEQTTPGEGTISDTSVSATVPVISSTPPESTRVTAIPDTTATTAPQETSVPQGTITLHPNLWTGISQEPLTPEELPPTYPPYFYNVEYGYGIEFPESWAGRYNIDMHDAANITFCQSASFGREGRTGGIIFTLVAMELEYTPELQDMEIGQYYYIGAHPLLHMLMGKNNKYAFSAVFPSDMQYGMEGPNAEAIGREYEAMVDDIRQLRFTLRLSDR